MRKRKSATIHSHFFLNISGISISFMILLLLFTSLLFYQHFTKLETQSSLRQLDYISGQLNYYLDSAQNYSKSILINEDMQSYITRYADSNAQIKGTEQLKIKDQILRIIQSTAFIHSVSIYSTDASMLLSTEPYPFSTDFDPQHISAHGTWMSVQKSSHNSRSISIAALSLIRPFYNYSTGDFLGYLEITIPEKEISRIYENNVTDTNHIYITDSNGYIKSSDNSLPLSKQYPMFSLLTKDKNYCQTYSSIIFYSPIPVLDWYVINEIQLLHFIMPSVSVFLVTLPIALLCILACLLVSNRVSRYITAPLDQLIVHTRKIKDGSWTPTAIAAREDKIGELLNAFNSMILSQEKLKNDLIEAQRIKDKTSLDLLQQQVNPHFLYNTLDNICALAEIEEKETLIDLVMNLSTFYREGLSNGKFYVTIGDELEITRAYLHIMQIRYYHKFEYRITCPPSLYQNPCLKLLLQPVVENSIYHGIKELEKKGLLEIIIVEQENQICFTIQDNGIGLSPEKESSIWNYGQEHFGISNIHQRVQLYYGTQYGLTIKNRPEGGCITTITIGKEALQNE